MKKTTKSRTTKKVEQVPLMQQYIQMRMQQMNVAKSTNRKALLGYCNIKPQEQVVITYDDEQRHKVAMKFKRLFICCRALAFLFECYADGMRDHANGLRGAGVVLKKILQAYDNLNAKLIDVDMACNQLVKASQGLEGVDELDIDEQNDTVIRSVFEVAMNCDANGNQLEQEYILVKMPKSAYNTMATANPLFASYDTFGGQWDLKD